MINKVNILVVDDRPEGILSVQAVLNSPEYNLITASSGMEALKHLLQHDFAVILLDVQMPIMNGFETAEVIKTREKSKDIPIIFMSAINQDEQYVYQGYSVGAVDYLLKPFDPYILRSKVSIFVEMYRKNTLIQHQAQKLLEAEIKAHAQKLDQLEIENLRRYQYLADSIPEIVFRLHADGQFDYFNKVWFDYTGLSTQDSQGLLWKNVVHPDDLPVLMGLFKYSIRDHGLECEVRLRAKTGLYRWHLVKIQAERYFDPEVVNSWLGTGTDIEDRKKNEEMQKFLSSAGEILVSSLDNQLTLKSVGRLVVPHLADWCAVDMLSEKGTFENVGFFHVDESVIPAKKMEYLLSVTDEVKLSFDPKKLCLPLKTKGRVVGRLTLAIENSFRIYDQHSITVAEELAKRVTLAFENSQLYALSKEAIEIRNNFLSMASHELNTPITSLKLQLQMVRKTLQKKTPDHVSQERFTRSIEASVKQVDRLINLVQVLLDVSKIQSGKLAFQFETINAQELVQEVVERNKELILNANCDLELLNCTGINVFWDKTRIEQVLTNLLNNAIKYAPGKLALRVFDQSDHVCIQMSDSGKGIPQEKLPSIFDRFERANTNSNIGGLGLGLYIVKQIVEGHRGQVEVISGEKGTTFTVKLPKDRPVEVLPVSCLG